MFGEIWVKPSQSGIVPAEVLEPLTLVLIHIMTFQEAEEGAAFSSFQWSLLQSLCSGEFIWQMVMEPSVKQ